MIFYIITSCKTKVEANTLFWEGLVCGKPSTKLMLKFDTKKNIFMCWWHRWMFLKTSTKFET